MYKFIFITLIFTFFLATTSLTAQITPIFPKNNATIQTTTPILKWQDNNLPKFPAYRVILWKKENAKTSTNNSSRTTVTTSSFTLKYVYSMGTRKNELKIPAGILQRGNSYVWQVKTLSSQNLSVAYFSFSIAGPPSSLTSSTNNLPLNSGNNLSGQIVFDFDKLGQVNSFSLSSSASQITFPQGLISPRGLSQESINGNYFLYRFDLAKPIPFNSLTAEAKLDNGTTLKITYDKLKLGTFKGMYDVGFDLYKDTPNFDNFRGNNFLDKGGTCLGIVFTVKHFFEDVDYATTKGVNITKVKPMDVLKVILKKKRFCAPDSRNFREFSIKHTDKLKKIMSFNHLDNLNPAALGDSLKSIFNIIDDRKTFRKFKRVLKRGRLPLLAMYQIKKQQKFKLPFFKKSFIFKRWDAGHAMLVYRIYEFSKKSLMCIYDPNILYRPSRPYHTYITYTAGRKHRAFKYHAEKGSSYDSNFASKYKEFFLMPSSKLLFSLSGILSDSWKKVNDFINDVAQKVINFINPIVSKITNKISKIKIKWPF